MQPPARPVTHPSAQYDFEGFLKQVLPLSSQVGKKNVDAKKLKASSDEETAARAMLGGDGPSKFLKGKVPILVFVEAWSLDIPLSLIFVSVLPLNYYYYYTIFIFIFQDLASSRFSAA